MMERRDLGPARWLSNPALPAILLRLDALAGKIDALINDSQLTGKI